MYHHDWVYIWDPRGIAKEHSKVIYDFSCGASDRLRLGYIADLEDFLEISVNRKIGTYLNTGTSSLASTKFQKNDIILFGNEYSGIDENIIQLCDEKLRIELPDGKMPKTKPYNGIESANKEFRNLGTPCLNVGASAAIIAYRSYIDLLKYSQPPEAER